MLLRQDNGRRYIHNRHIEEVNLPVSEVKASVNARRLDLVLNDGERVNVPVDGGRDPNLNIFPIFAWVRRRVHQHKALSRKR